MTDLAQHVQAVAGTAGAVLATGLVALLGWGPQPAPVPAVVAARPTARATDADVADA